ncbi:cis-prenyltransferase [Artemisia annua]|uniref:Alkyl transferase n=1 Tax=Artemisia annua TaxID=35608 RepID=A0A2U1KTR9_ARTAN|nr:cis-prenyltransferase [Artemisia annua]
MVTLFLKMSSPLMLASKTTNILSRKPLYNSTTCCNLAVTTSYTNEPSALCNGLRAESMPKHVAILMDRQRRTGKAGDTHNDLGYGQVSLMDIARICIALGIKVLSIYPLSRPKEEIDYANNVKKWDLEVLSSNEIRLSVIGNRNTIPESQLEIISHVEEATITNKSLHIVEAVNYSGRSDIIRACIGLAEKLKDGLTQPSKIDENIFQQELETNCLDFPNPDLVIRTGGKRTIGNFMLWQSAYSELYFVEKDASQFNKADFIEALDAYQKRNRRFGGNELKGDNPAQEGRLVEETYKTVDPEKRALLDAEPEDVSIILTRIGNDISLQWMFARMLRRCRKQLNDRCKMSLSTSRMLRLSCFESLEHSHQRMGKH